MIEIVAQSSNLKNRMQLPLQRGTEVVLGRQSEPLSVTWDDCVSRHHAIILLRADDRVEVKRHPKARNPIFFRGVKRDNFVLSIGEHFVIGSTTFTVSEGASVEEGRRGTPQVTEHTFLPEELRQTRFRDATGRIDVLCRLPELIAGSASENELLVRVANVILQATTSAAEVFVLRVLDSKIDVLQSVYRIPGAKDRKPSSRLVREAASSGRYVLHMWRDQQSAEQEEANFTVGDNVDWAFAVPILSDACPGWVIYVTGRRSPGLDGLSRDNRLMETEFAGPPDDLIDDVKFTEVVATTLGNLQQVKTLQKRQAGLSRFFAPVVMDALAGRDTLEVLKPREEEISVLFCDLRGFSKKSEENAGNLMSLLERVSEALGVMTRRILNRDGVIGDFHGDAAMGFWGWPLKQPDSAERACQTALDILSEFQQHGASQESPLGGFRCGIGIASGPAVAGRIGTTDQVKVTAFGPVVNLASRLEGMTKLFAAEILLDEQTAETIKATLSPSVVRVRRLAKVRPVGMQLPLVVHQLLPPASTPGTISDAGIKAYESALDALLALRWEEAFELLHDVPASDRVKDFLTVFIASHGRTAPENWDGVISLNKK